MRHSKFLACWKIKIDLQGICHALITCQNYIGPQRCFCRWDETKRALNKLTCLHLETFTNAHKEKLHTPVLNRIRQHYLKDGVLNEKLIAQMTSNLHSEDWKSLVPVAEELLQWIESLEEYDRLCERQFILNGQFHK